MRKRWVRGAVLSAVERCVGCGHFQQQRGDTCIATSPRAFVRRWRASVDVMQQAGQAVTCRCARSALAAERCDERGGDVIQEEVADVAVLLDRPLVRLEDSGENSSARIMLQFVRTEVDIHRNYLTNYHSITRLSLR